MKFQLETGEIVEPKLIHSRPESYVTWQTWQVPDGRVFQVYSDRYPAWMVDGVLPHTAVKLTNADDADVKRWAGPTYLSPSEKKRHKDMFRGMK